jgi:predicted nucleotidyltransferase
MIQALLTGSRVYGRPTKKSDLDVVMLLTPFELATMEKQADEVEGNDYDTGDSTSKSLRFGNLNVIALTDPVAFGVFEKGTKALKDLAKQNGRGLEREDAVARLAGLRYRHGLAGPPRDRPTTSEPGDDIPF